MTFLELVNSVPYGILISIIGLVQAISLAFLSRGNKRRKQVDEEMDKGAKIRATESRLSMGLMSANASLAHATGLALKEGRTNGKMDAAILEVEQAQLAYYSFINDVAATQMTAE